MNGVVVIGVGNPFRSDDGAGIEAARRLRELGPEGVVVLEHDGEPATLLEAWEGAALAYVVDAVLSSDESGTVHRVEVGGVGHVPGSRRRDSSHALGLGDAVELADALGRLPERLVLIGITGESFEVGGALSEPVARAARDVAEELAAELGQGVHA